MAISLFVIGAPKQQLDMKQAQAVRIVKVTGRGARLRETALPLWDSDTLENSDRSISSRLSLYNKATRESELGQEMMAPSLQPKPLLPGPYSSYKNYL